MRTRPENIRAGSYAGCFRLSAMGRRAYESGWRRPGYEGPELGERVATGWPRVAGLSRWATGWALGGDPPPSRMAVYRSLVRHGLVSPRQRRKRREDYLRWERPAPMQLWQMDIVGGVFLTDGTEAKVVTGVDDHSRYCVIASVVARPTGRAVPSRQCVRWSSVTASRATPGSSSSNHRTKAARSARRTRRVVTALAADRQAAAVRHSGTGSASTLSTSALGSSPPSPRREAGDLAHGGHHRAGATTALRRLAGTGETAAGRTTAVGTISMIARLTSHN